MCPYACCPDKYDTLLLRAAAIDQAARDLVTEAAATARSRDTATIPVPRPAPGTRQARGRPARVASQDAPATRGAGRPASRLRR
jgi:hypothetical protein